MTQYTLLGVLAIVFASGSILATTGPAYAGSIEDDISELFSRMSDVESLASQAASDIQQFTNDITELFARISDLESLASSTASDLSGLQELAVGPPGPPGVDTLGGLSCTTDQIAKWDGTQWICANEVISAGSFSTEFMLDLGPDTVTNAETYNNLQVLQNFKIINLPSSTEEYTIPINFMRIEALMAVDSPIPVSSDSFKIILEESTRGEFSQILSINTRDAALDYRTANHILFGQEQVFIESGTTEKFFRVIAFTTDNDPSVPTGSFDNFQLLMNFPLPMGATIETIP